MMASGKHRAPVRPVLGRVPHSGGWSAAVILFCLVLGNFSYLFGLRTNDPSVYDSGLGRPGSGLVAGKYTIDPNDGWTAESLGHLAAQSWLHGHVPLWNVYEGLGQPLAGEMQSAAFFLPSFCCSFCRTDCSSCTLRLKPLLRSPRWGCFE